MYSMCDIRFTAANAKLELSAVAEAVASAVWCGVIMFDCMANERRNGAAADIPIGNNSIWRTFIECMFGTQSIPEQLFYFTENLCSLFLPLTLCIPKMRSILVAIFALLHNERKRMCGCDARLPDDQ